MPQQRVIRSSDGYRPIAGFALVVIVVIALAAPLASSPQVPGALGAEIAPTGRLRAGINYNNPVLARRDATTGEITGIAADLSRELARRIGVPVDVIAYDATGQMAAAVTTGAWDISYLGIDPARATDIEFTAAYINLEGQASGFVADSLKRHGLGPDDAVVAPAASVQ